MVNMKGRGPFVRAKSGRFEVSIWHWKKLVPAEPGFVVTELGVEQEVDVERVSIHYSRWNKHSQSWQETTIWCNTDELRQLVQALDDLNLRDEDEAV